MDPFNNFGEIQKQIMRSLNNPFMQAAREASERMTAITQVFNQPLFQQTHAIAQIANQSFAASQWAALKAELPNTSLWYENLSNQISLSNSAIIEAVQRAAIMPAMPRICVPDYAWETMRRQLELATQLPEWTTIKEHVESEIDVDDILDIILDTKTTNKKPVSQVKQRPKRRNRMIKKAKKHTFSRPELIALFGVFTVIRDHIPDEQLRYQVTLTLAVILSILATTSGVLALIDPEEEES